MDLWSSAVPSSVHLTADEHPPGKLTAVGAVVMWMTVILPYLGLGYLLVVLLAGRSAHWLYLVLFLLNYVLIGFGITIGYHRMLTHKSFETYGWLKAAFLILGCMAFQGSPIRWSTTHRRHHQKSDREGDPHSPCLHGSGAIGILRGLWHAHTGWLLHPEPSGSRQTAKDLQNCAIVRRIDQTYQVWLLIGALLPPVCAWFIEGSLAAVIYAALWGTVMRIALMHHATWSVNSVCHFFGYRSYASHDQSRNNPVVALIALGEGWHNNHHAFPTSARHGLKWYEVDFSYLIIRGLARLGLVWNVRVPTRGETEQRAARIPQR